MTNVTRHALRVYAALSGLKPNGGGDIIDALIPFMEPILGVMHGKIYDPDLVALGIRRLYGWQFNRDIAEQFAGRLVSKGYLKRAASNILVVSFSQQDQAAVGQVEIAALLERVIDEFENFPPKITDLFRFSLTRDDLTDILIRFLVSLDAYTEEAFAEQVERLKLDIEKKTLLDQLDEGGQPLTPENRYLCARFVKHLVKEKPEFVPHLARLASIGLLTDVVEDFIKPTTPAAKSDLTCILDAPVAQTLLGLAGTSAQNELRNVVESLRAIGCTFVVFPVSCEEMSRNLSSVLRLQPSERHGPTQDALRNREVDEDFVRSVINNPERALEAVGVSVRSIDLDAYPNSIRHFDKDMHEEFMSGITWKHASIDAREHDAICTTLTMRLRAGVKKSDPLASKFVFITTNPVFVRYVREFCRRHRLINARQTPPVMLQRELATNAWLRTGLGGRASDETRNDIPRSHLIASCDKVLRTRKEVTQAVHQKLRDFAPEKIEQYELLLADQRSVQRLMDETLGDERLVTSETAEKLLEEMRKATALEVQEEYDRKLRQQARRHGVQARALKEEAAAALHAQAQAAAAAVKAQQEAAEAELKAKQEEIAAREALLASALEEKSRLERAVEDTRTREMALISELMGRVNRLTRCIDMSLLFLVLGVCLVVFFGSMLGYMPTNSVVWWSLVPFSLITVYQLVQELRQKPKLGIQNLLDAVARSRFRRGMRKFGLDQSHYMNSVEIGYGQIAWKQAGPMETLALVAPLNHGMGRVQSVEDEAA